ncbi:hypothetical protein SeMB42_g07076 [Synchytrium endobioticum]|uniref:Uncharacterized protein n=1 Tax=Synchytrium endobioticum TaxID=286115 RepID=A0A507C601_9FUNG|nr:hypothetical protein SeMB42_g07076 [Synchytrium endobioticum]
MRCAGVGCSSTSATDRPNILEMTSSNRRLSVHPVNSTKFPKTIPSRDASINHSYTSTNSPILKATPGTLYKFSV